MPTTQRTSPPTTCRRGATSAAGYGLRLAALIVASQWAAPAPADAALHLGTLTPEASNDAFKMRSNVQPSHSRNGAGALAIMSVLASCVTAFAARGFAGAQSRTCCPTKATD